MTFSVNRRGFLQAASSAVAAGALSSVAGRASAQSSDELRVVVNGGASGKAKVEAWVKPFEAATGIKVNAITDDFTLAQLELMAESKNVTVDVVGLEASAHSAGAKKGRFEKIDYSIYKTDERDGLVDFAKEEFGVAYIIYSYNIVYNTEKYPANKPRPTTWAEFWDVDKYPGVRSLVSGASGSEGPWEEALLGAGVAPEALYPMDIDKIFASLDKIKPHVRKWFTGGSEIYNIMRDKNADIVESYDGRAQLLVNEGAPVEINRNQAKLTWDLFAIPKGSPNVGNAQKFIEFATRADRQAAFSKLIPYGPANRNAFKLLPQELGRKLASHPDFLATSIVTKPAWYTEVGADGMSNIDRLVQRWNEWILL
ncbi:spermidine/putrescine-binding periplasmic protein [Rhizobium leguminosarum bv. trifolii WSM597]|uniref:Spermidine/putrescine-binding periplasmic protein n=1 Tax=Rhizobium leguminosarum bv. trifolii WSM597 TaxID=754764 RepID=I9NGR4_RHILT|nr:ABC transporter substrate-binding protein [Rhizobium leguminosarum]EJB07154.1 spermidine/putrescine-binding periplasmic protein [Rhizobium leguminosarum bv. trifolii WSM597]